ncbi:MAG: carbamoyltransferase N-terminal domain-containing protein, partial [Myxococcota bacterium]|nr:carbamoyltransferase N-terminal domain-containing protein [Myxococcota bacterium]
MIVLGINDNHDASAALVVDGEVAAAVGQERIDRIKNSSLFPWDAMDEVLRIGGVRPGDVDQVVFGSHFTPSTALRRFPHTHQSVKKRGGQFSPMLNAYVLYQVALRASGTWEAEAASSRRLLARRLSRYGYRATVTTMDHHLGHAASAYLSQTRDPSLVLTVDAMGDGTSVTVGAARGGRIELLYRQSGLAAINTYYS